MLVFMDTFGDESGSSGGGVLLPVASSNSLSMSSALGASLLLVVVVVAVWKVVLLGVRFWCTIRSSIDRCWEGSEFERTRLLGWEGIGVLGCAILWWRR